MARTHKFQDWQGLCSKQPPPYHATPRHVFLLFYTLCWSLGVSRLMYHAPSFRKLDDLYFQILMKEHKIFSHKYGNNWFNQESSVEATPVHHSLLLNGIKLSRQRLHINCQGKMIPLLWQHHTIKWSKLISWMGQMQSTEKDWSPI